MIVKVCVGNMNMNEIVFRFKGLAYGLVKRGWYFKNYRKE